MKLDAKTKKAIDSLSEEEIDRDASYAFEHEILWYGINALTHYRIMDKVREVTPETLPEFAEKYKLQRGNQFWNEHHVAVPVDSLRGEGIYVPSYSHNLVSLFENDYFANRGFSGVFDRDNFMRLSELKKRRWENSTLLDKEIQERGLQWSRELWQDCVAGFNKYKNGTDNMKKQSEKVTKLGEKLIDYYSGIILGGAK